MNPTMAVAVWTFQAFWRWMASKRSMVLVTLAALYVAHKRRAIYADPDFRDNLRWEVRWRWMAANRSMVLVTLAALYIAHHASYADRDFRDNLRWEARRTAFWVVQQWLMRQMWHR
ncbi:unnamed protein product [Symbiodinium sp. CCMP2592]|nr:unnamed protein product [Symbiodinium sp. CCMP2592]